MYDDEEVPTLTIVGVGEMGAAVVNQLLKAPVYSASLLICHGNADVLRASSAPNKVLFETNRPDDEAKWHLTDALSNLELPGRMAIIISDLNSPDEYRQMALLIQLFKEQGKLTVPTVGLYTDTEQRIRVDRMILDLQQQADSVWICTQEQQDYLMRVEQIARAVSVLTSFCESVIDTADFMDVKRVIGKARMAVATATGKGDDRATDIVKSLINQVQAQTMGGPAIDRILLITSTGKEKPLLLREQVTISNGISEFIGREVKLFKFGGVTDTSLGERINVALLMGMPF
jgi:cell division protein FtsZ